MKFFTSLVTGGLFACVATASLAADQSAQDLAKATANPIASLISVPFQLDYNSNLGPTDDGDQWTLFFQPVIPVSLSDSTNLIVRTIVPFIDVDPGVSGIDDDSGVGNIVQSFFFSPKAPTAGGLIWGAGPILQYPTAADGLGSDNFGVGITAIGLKQSGPHTYGALAYNLWSVEDDEENPKYNTFYLQPFYSYAWPSTVSLTVSLESSYDWENDDWSIPLNLQLKKIYTWGKQPVQLGIGARYWLASPDDSAADGWGARGWVSFLFPK